MCKTIGIKIVWLFATAIVLANVVVVISMLVSMLSV